jgi:peptide/nickel transport system substrate-binding protein
LDTYQAYYPKHVLDTLDPAAFYDWEFWRHPIGNGPYRYLRHVPKTALELEATPDFYLGTPRIERVTFKFGTGGSGIPELLAGNVHVVELDPASRAPIARDPRFTFTWNSEFANDFAKFTIFFNHRHSILKHAQVRRAITHAIDRRELVGLLQLPEALPIADVPYTDRLVPHLPAPLAYDPDRARALLADAGWTDRDRDGVRDDGTTPLAFTLLAPEGEALRIAVLVQERLRQVGIAVEVEPVGGGLGVFWSRQRRGEFDAALGFWSPGHLQTFGAESFLGYRNAAVARLLQAADTVAKPQVVDSLYRLAWREFARDIPVTYLFPLARMWAVDRRLQGLVSPPRGDPFASLGDLWWDDGP